MSEYTTKVITKLHIKGTKLYIELDGLHHLFLYVKESQKPKYRHIIKEGKILTDEELRELEEHVINRGKRRVMFLLAKQDYPKAQLATKLQQDGYCEKLVDCILGSFVEKGYINDEQLAYRRIQSYKTLKSKREIQYLLKQKGFDENLVKEIIKENITEPDEIETALNLLITKFTSKKQLLEPNDLKNKALSYLGRKGFTMYLAIQAYQQFTCEESNSDEYYEDNPIE